MSKARVRLETAEYMVEVELTEDHDERTIRDSAGFLCDKAQATIEEIVAGINADHIEVNDDPGIQRLESEK